MSYQLISDLFFWAPKIFLALMFVFVGVVFFRKGGVTLRFTRMLFLIYFCERIIELGLRTYATLTISFDSFSQYTVQVQLMPTLSRVLESEAIGIFIAACVWFLLAVYAKKTNEEKLDMSDVNIFTFGVLISGWPNFLIYLCIVFLLAAFGLVMSLAIGRAKKMIVTPYFAAAGIIIIFWGWEISKWVGLYAIR